MDDHGLGKQPPDPVKHVEHAWFTAFRSRALVPKCNSLLLSHRIEERKRKHAHDFLLRCGITWCCSSFVVLFSNNLRSTIITITRHLLLLHFLLLSLSHRTSAWRQNIRRGLNGLARVRNFKSLTRHPLPCSVLKRHVIYRDFTLRQHVNHPIRPALPSQAPASVTHFTQHVLVLHNIHHRVVDLDLSNQVLVVVEGCATRGRGSGFP
mmetsp:Transcript_6183/g.13202  ORF Transcript_6183/g.13202 Transcript_6183/m.13202 type:complete len:208 (+) Transcript_6183:258-881(+)